MLILLVTVFSALCAPCATVKVEEVCYGKSVNFPDATHPKRYNGSSYFTPSDGGRRITSMEDGKAKDPRIKVSTSYSSLTDLNKNDEGVYTISPNGKRSNVLRLKIQDCAEEISEYYKHEWSYRLPKDTHYVEYTPLDNPDVTVISWNKTNPWNNNKTKGYVKNRDWKISGVTQSNNNGFYNFRQRDGYSKSRIRLTVEENTQYYYPKMNERIFIGNHWTGRPWSVTFKQDMEDEQERVIQHGQLVLYSQFYGRLNIQENGIEINPVESTDSGTFEFRDKQDNSALSAKVYIISDANPIIICVFVAVVALLLGICCCCCKKRCCKKDKSTASATGLPILINHDKSTPTPPVVYYHPSQPNTAVYPPQPANVYPPQPAFIHPPPPAFINPPQPTNINPPQPTNINPPQPTNINPPQPTNINPPQPTNINPPQPTNINPPQPTNVNPPQPTNINPPQPEPSSYPPHFEVGSSTFQASAAGPTFSSDFLSSDAEPRFQSNSFPSAPPLSSDPPTCDVYASEKSHFLGTN